MGDFAALWVGIALIIGNAFFVGAEFAIMSARHSQVEPLVDENKRGAVRAMYAIEHVSEMLATAQFGVTVCSVSLGAIAEPAIAHQVEPLLLALNLPGEFAHPIGFVIALLIASYLHVVFGEMVPKNISIAVPARAVLLLAPPLVLIAKVLHPLIVVLNATANRGLRLLRVEPRDEVESTFTAEEVAAIVDESQREGMLLDQQGLLGGVIEFSDKNAGDVMIPARELVTVTEGVTPREIEAFVTETGFSRFPVLDESGKMSGYVHLKDVLLAEDLADTEYDQPLPATYFRAVVSVAHSEDIEDVLRAMQQRGAHLARVVDDDGPSIGAIFLEDVLEVLVGEVKDVMQR